MASTQLSDGNGKPSAPNGSKDSQNGHSPLTLLGVPGEDLPPPSPGVLRMLKTTTELGDIESLAVYGKNHTHKVSQFPREPRSLPKIPRAARMNGLAARSYSPASAPTGYLSQRTTPSSQDSSHHERDAPQVSSRAHGKHRCRSYSLNHTSKPQTTHGAYRNLVYPGHENRPIQPHHILAYPTRLKRFDYRPSSPAVDGFAPASQRMRNMPIGKPSPIGSSGPSMPFRRHAPNGPTQYRASRIPRLARVPRHAPHSGSHVQPYLRSTARHAVAFYEPGRYPPVDARSADAVGYLLDENNVVPPPLFYDYSERFEEDRRYFTDFSTPSYTSGSADVGMDESKTSNTSDKVYSDSEESPLVAELPAHNSSEEEENVDFLASSAYLSVLLSENGDDVEADQTGTEGSSVTKAISQSKKKPTRKSPFVSNLGEARLQRLQWRRRQAFSHLPRLERSRPFSVASGCNFEFTRRPTSSISWHNNNPNAITQVNLDQLTKRSRSVSKPYWKLPSVNLNRMNNRRDEYKFADFNRPTTGIASKALTTKRVSFDTASGSTPDQNSQTQNESSSHKNLSNVQNGSDVPSYSTNSAREVPLSIETATLKAENRPPVEWGSIDTLLSKEAGQNSKYSKPLTLPSESGSREKGRDRSTSAASRKDHRLEGISNSNETWISSPSDLSPEKAIMEAPRSSTMPENGFCEVPQQLEESMHTPFAADLVATMEATLRKSEASADLDEQQSERDITSDHSTKKKRSDSPPESRPWNLEESYPWSSDAPSIEVTLPPPSPAPAEPVGEQPKRKSKTIRPAASVDDGFRRHRRDWSRPHTSDHDHDHDMPTLMEFLRSNAADENPHNYSLFENFQRRLGVSSSDTATIASRGGAAWGPLGRPVSRAHSPGDRYPTTSLAAPAPPINIEDVRSFFSDDSSQMEPRNSLKKRLTHLRAKLPTSRSQSTDDVRGYERVNTLLHPLASRSSAGAATTGCGHGPDAMVYAYDGTVGMSNVEYRAKKAIGRLKLWWHRGGELVREIRGGKSRPADVHMFDMGA